VVMIDNEGNTHIIRRAETIDTIRALEAVPDYLKA